MNSINSIEDLNLSKLVYGAFAIGGWFWGGADERDAVAAIETAIDNGVTSIDTAPVYGMGHSEEIVGRVIKNKRDQVQILTKFGMRWDQESGVFAFDTQTNEGEPVKVYKFNGRQSVIEECERSLRRLNTDYIDLYQMHWPDNTTPIEETMEALDILKQQGKIKAIGVCNCPVDLLDRARKITEVSFNQVAYSMLNRSIENDLVPYCIDHKVGILPHTILHKGLLTGKFRSGHKFAEGDHRKNNALFSEENLSTINETLYELELVARSLNCTLSQLVIRWTLQQPGISAVLVGARNAAQMLENLHALSFELSHAEKEQIDTTLCSLELNA